MPCDVDRLVPQRPVEVLPGNAHRKTSEQHVADRHRVNYGIEPFDEQELDVGRLTSDLDHGPRFDFSVGDRSSQCTGGLLERFRSGCAPSLHSDIGIVGKMLPARPASGM